MTTGLFWRHSCCCCFHLDGVKTDVGLVRADDPLSFANLLYSPVESMHNVLRTTNDPFFLQNLQHSPVKSMNDVRVLETDVKILVRAGNHPSVENLQDHLVERMNDVVMMRTHDHPIVENLRYSRVERINDVGVAKTNGSPFFRIFSSIPSSRCTTLGCWGWTSGCR